MAVSSKGQRASIRRFCLALAALTTWALIGAGSSRASTIVVGSPLTDTFTDAVAAGNPATWANAELSEPGANATSPTNGVVLSWRLAGQYGSDPFRLRILRPAGAGTYVGVGTSEPETPSGILTQTFTTDLPIQAGDLIGLDSKPSAEIAASSTAEASDTEAIWVPQLADGTSARAPNMVNPGSELAFNAEVQPAPVITATINPAFGPTSGGTRVTILGTDFTAPTAVKFGKTPASSYTVNSEDAITAISPPSTSAESVAISVTTAAGTTPSTPADQFSYTASAATPTPNVGGGSCIVPKLAGKKLKAARKALAKADCKLGKVKGHKSTRTKVKKQKPKPGTVLAPGAKIGVTVK
jgi:IPT/TIG domain/PASTA domain